MILYVSVHQQIRLKTEETSVKKDTITTSSVRCEKHKLAGI